MDAKIAFFSLVFFCELSAYKKKVEERKEKKNHLVNEAKTAHISSLVPGLELSVSKSR